MRIKLVYNVTSNLGVDGNVLCFVSNSRVAIGAQFGETKHVARVPAFRVYTALRGMPRVIHPHPFKYPSHTKYDR
jgi:hypothetical protein